MEDIMSAQQSGKKGGKKRKVKMINISILHIC